MDVIDRINQLIAKRERYTRVADDIAVCLSFEGERTDIAIRLYDVWIHLEGIENASHTSSAYGDDEVLLYNEHNYTVLPVTLAERVF